MSSCGVGSKTHEDHLRQDCKSPGSCDYTQYGPAPIQFFYRGSALNHPDSTPEFIIRTKKRRAKNAIAKQSRRRNRK